MKKFILLMAACASMLAVSCGKVESPQGKQTLSVNPWSLEFQATGNESQTVTVTAENVKWEITQSTESKAWITVTNTDDKTLSVTVSDNETDSPRNGAFLVKALDAENVENIKVSVTQAAGEKKDYTISVDPSSMTFAGEGAEPQEATVTVSDPSLKWTVAPEDAIKDWVTVTVEGDKITVSVADNPETAERAGNVVITPGVENVNQKAIRVKQEGKILPPSLEINKMSLNFPFRGSFGESVLVNAVNVVWSAKSSDTPDVVGDPVSWIKVKTFNDENNSYFIVSVDDNTLLEERTGYVVVTSSVEEIPNVTITVTQEPGIEFISNLTGDTEITDLQTGVNNHTFISPNQEWHDRDVCFWDIDLWAATVTRTKDQVGWKHYTGAGTRLNFSFNSSRIVFNYDEVYELPEGDYIVQAPTMDEKNNPVYAPFTIDPGEYTSGNMSVVRGGWYLEVSGGDTEDTYAGMAPFSSGKINVARNGEDYILTFDLKDDAGNGITGTCVTKLDNRQINFYPEDEPQPDDPNNPEQPEEPGNPDEPTPYRR